MGIKMRVNVTGGSETYQYLNQVMGRLQNNRGKAVLNATNNVAKYWQKNFTEEGSRVGGWPDLALRTQEDRTRQGYSPEHPIMIRNQGLFTVSTRSFAEAEGPGSFSATTPYDPRGITARGTLTISNGLAQLSVGGPQVFNQWPGRRTDRPARPFWFVNKTVTLEATKGVADWIKDEVLT